MWRDRRNSEEGGGPATAFLLDEMRDEMRGKDIDWQEGNIGKGIDSLGELGRKGFKI